MSGPQGLLLDDGCPAVLVLAASVLDILQLVVESEASLANLLAVGHEFAGVEVVDRLDRRDHGSRTTRTRLLEGIEFIDGNGALLKFASGVICFWQAWSILENEAAANDRPWARILRRILVDKTERYLGITLDELRRGNPDCKV